MAASGTVATFKTSVSLPPSSSSSSSQLTHLRSPSKVLNFTPAQGHHSPSPALSPSPKVPPVLMVPGYDPKL
ncbi:hypothetical protein Bca52824_090100 [Brassica carinata]|uniref:Uncharacterized protein n=1 Tax=Brassica carinata TaxID=52824 RepID=A0A8X7NUM0_BRACI|nr:hypothetical protein Bca52824_090100 [Brassica carinata]